jgi:5-methylcytosine-specific restriction endonuclease McrA
MTFAKKHIPWNKGKKGLQAGENHPRWGAKLSDETKRKISESEKGKIIPSDVRRKMSLAHKGMVSPNKGKKLSKDWIANISKSHKGLNTWIKGTKQTQEHIEKHTYRGDKNPNWKGGITPINQKIRKSLEYKLWRMSVYERDSFQCIWCGSKKEIHADHIKRFSDYPELRFAIDNGRTLCKVCHMTTDTWGSKKQKYE